MKTKQKLNVRLLRRIQRHILEEPRRFFMKWYSLRVNSPREWRRRRYADASLSMPPCGTAACICGWANLLTKGKDPSDVKRAKIKLGLVDTITVFNSDNWPAPFDDQYVVAKTPKQRAKVACARINHLIKTGE